MSLADWPSVTPSRRDLNLKFVLIFLSKFLLVFGICFLQEIHHCRRQIKYSKDKMWYLAKLVSDTGTAVNAAGHRKMCTITFYLHSAGRLFIYLCDQCFFYLFIFLFQSLIIELEQSLC